MNGLNLATQVWVIIYGGKLSFTVRVASTFMLQGVCVVLIPVLAHLGGATGFWSVFALLLVFGVIMGLNAGSVYSMAGGLPPKFMGAIFLGMGISGIASNVFRALSLVLWPASENPEN